jgi:hypothetical protein
MPRISAAFLVASVASVASAASAACARPATGGSLRPAARLAEARASHTTTALPDGTLLVIGGFRKTADGHTQAYSATTEIVDPAAGTVTRGPALLHPRAGHSATPLPDGRILVAGGWDDVGMVRTVELYDPTTAAFTAAADLTEPRGGFAATALADGRVLFTGGGDGVATRTAEIFDPADDQFRPTGEMITGRIGHSATLLADGRVLVVGGAAGRDRVLVTAEIFDPAAGAFTAAASLPVERYKHAAIRLPDDRVLIAGGSSARDWRGKYDTTEIYDPAADRFVTGPALTTPRFKLTHAVALLGDAVAIAGGAATIEVLGAGTDQPAPGRVVARLGRVSYFGTLTAVGDRLVVVGGYDDRIRASNGVWVVQLATDG